MNCTEERFAVYVGVYNHDHTEKLRRHFLTENIISIDELCLIYTLQSHNDWRRHAH